MVNARAGYGRRDARGRVGKRRRDGIRRWRERERDKMATRFRGRLDGQGARYRRDLRHIVARNGGRIAVFFLILLRLELRDLLGQFIRWINRMGISETRLSLFLTRFDLDPEKNETKTKRWNVSLFNARIFHPKMNS